ncbi:MAG TPA: RNA 2'-phosphotransferase [Anaerolineae bacterium]|nr:RNA 2'-phosphotransferase [Anaerolineae bacterium]
MNLTTLSKKMSRALRHQPEWYGVELDEAGWTATADLLAGLNRRHPWLGEVTEADLRAALARPGKRRFEMRDGRIRALYGHSVPVKIYKERQTPPEILWHGTSPNAAAQILREGLKPMRRQYVHLSSDVETAWQVGRRKAPRPVILRVQARQAFAAGVGFYDGNDTTWLADAIPPMFVEIRADDKLSLKISKDWRSGA